jgi:hypothetical protein
MPDDGNVTANSAGDTEIVPDNAERVTATPISGVAPDIAGIELPDPTEIGFDPVYAGELPDENAEPGRAIMPVGASAEVERAGEYITFGANFAVFDRATPFEDWQSFFSELVNRLEFANKALPWLVGDALNFAMQHYPDDAYSQFLSETEYAYGTLRNMAYVAGRWAPIDRDTTLPWSHHFVTSGLRKDAPRLAAAMVRNAAKTGASRRELADQANQASRQVRADRKAAPVGQLDEPKIETEIHRPGCPSCTCTGPKVLGKPGRPSPSESKRAARKNGATAEAAPKGRRGKAAAVVTTPKRGKAAPAPKPIGTRKGRRGRTLEPNPTPVQIVGANDVADDAEPLNGAVFSDGDGGTFEVAIDRDEFDREPDPAGIA